MRVIDGPEAPVGVVIGAGACTEWAHCPKRGGLPVMVVMSEACEARHAACVVVLQPLEKFTKFLSAFLLLGQPLTLLL